MKPSTSTPTSSSALPALQPLPSRAPTEKPASSNLPNKNTTPHSPCPSINSPKPGPANNSTPGISNNLASAQSQTSSLCPPQTFAAASANTPTTSTNSPKTPTPKNPFNPSSPPHPTSAHANSSTPNTTPPDFYSCSNN